MLALVTPTGGRPEAFALLERYMAAQTFGGDVLWVVVDDGQEPTPLGEPPKGWNRVVVRPQPVWAPGQNTQHRNLEAGLDMVDALAPDARVAVIEDDDYYAPGWLDALASFAPHAEMIGEAPARYYHVGRRRWAGLDNKTHCSLRCTAFRGRRILDELRAVIRTRNVWVDAHIWSTTDPRRTAIMKTQLTVGLKGLPGRAGITHAHTQAFGKPDPEAEVLRSWLGDDAEPYLAHYRPEVIMPDTVKVRIVKPFTFPVQGTDKSWREEGEEVEMTEKQARIYCDMKKRAVRVREQRTTAIRSGDLETRGGDGDEDETTAKPSRSTKRGGRQRGSKPARSRTNDADESGSDA